MRGNENLAVIKDLINGRPLNFGGYGWISFELNPYNHTYWIKNRSEDIYCIKTYPDPEGKISAGVAFDINPYFLFEVAKVFGLGFIQDAYIGTNGRDVRIVIPRDGKPEPITSTLDGKFLGTYLQRPLTNFIAFSQK